MATKIAEYAQLLYVFGEKGEAQTIGQFMYGFVTLLAENGDLPKAEAIISVLEELVRRREGVVEAEIGTARKLDEETIKAVTQYVKKIKPAAKKVELKEQVDPAMLGGIRLMVDGYLFDATVKKQLINLKNSLIQ